MRYNSLLDRALMAVAISGAAIPTFFLGILLILIFAVRLRWLPSGGYVPIDGRPRRAFQSMLLPAFALGFSSAGLLARLVRSSMLDVMREDYVRTALAKGLPERLVIVATRLRNALIPALTVIGISLGGSAGRRGRDRNGLHDSGHGPTRRAKHRPARLPVIQGAVITIAMPMSLSISLVDVLYVYIDPRVRLGAAE